MPSRVVRSVNASRPGRRPEPTLLKRAEPGALDALAARNPSFGLSMLGTVRTIPLFRAGDDCGQPVSVFLILSHAA